MLQSGSFPHRGRIERRYRRFSLQFPVEVSFSSAGLLHNLRAVSRNVSVGGLLLKSEDQIPAHTPIKLTMNVAGFASGHAVRLLGEGEVVRTESLGPDAGFAIAIECYRPIREMRDDLSAAG
jgi:hypothetical protein